MLRRGQGGQITDWSFKVLVLNRKADESIIIGSNITLRVLAIRGKIVRLGIDAPGEVTIRRAELPQLGSALQIAARSEQCITGEPHDAAP